MKGSYKIYLGSLSFFHIDLIAKGGEGGIFPFDFAEQVGPIGQCSNDWVAEVLSSNFGCGVFLTFTSQ